MKTDRGGPMVTIRVTTNDPLTQREICRALASLQGSAMAAAQIGGYVLGAGEVVEVALVDGGVELVAAILGDLCCEKCGDRCGTKLCARCYSGEPR